MDQSCRKNVTPINKHLGQFEYNKRWVDKETFRTFVYDKYGKAVLADSYDKFMEMTSSGLYVAKKEDISLIKSKGKQKNDPICPAS